MITDMKIPEEYHTEWMQYSYRKHRVKTALMRIFKDEFEAGHFAFNKMMKSNNLKEQDFWGNVRTEITGFSVGRSLYGNTKENEN